MKPVPPPRRHDLPSPIEIETLAAPLHRVTLHGRGADRLWAALEHGAGPAAEAQFLAEVVTCLETRRGSGLVDRLGLDFTLALLRGGDRVLLARGPSSRLPLYFAPHADRCRLSTRLWDGDGPRRVAHAFLAGHLANAALPAPIECDHTLATAREGWLRVPRGVVLEWRGGRARLLGRFACQPRPHEDGDRERLESDLRGALDDRIRALAGGRRFACELSGGIDSGIIASRARRLLPESFVGGASLVSGFHELRREQSFIEATAAHAGTGTRFVDVSQHLPFSQLREVPAHDEPSMSSLPWALQAGVLAAARESGAEVLLHGIGGDQVFCDPPRSFRALGGWPAPMPFARLRLRLAVRRERRAIRKLYCGGPRSLAPLPAFLLYDGWCDRYTAPAMGLRYEGPYVDRDVLRACAALRAAAGTVGGPPKELPRRVFADDLAPSVHQRRGKAGFDGVHQRGLRRNIDSVCALVESESPRLERAGLSPGRLVRSLRASARAGWGSADAPALAALAWAVWLHALRRDALLDESGDD